MTILYSCVASGPVILCSDQKGVGNFEDVARNMLHKIPTSLDMKTTYESDNYMFHCLVNNGILFMCVAESDFGKRLPYAFLTEVNKAFSTGSLTYRAPTASDGELNTDFRPVLARNMERFSDTKSSGDSMSKLQEQVSEVKGVMTQNIDRILERGERLDDLLTKSSSLEATSQTFQQTSRRVQRKMWWRNKKMTLILVLVTLIVITIFILIILFSTGVLPGNSGGDAPPPSTTTTTTTVATTTIVASG